MTHQMPNCLNGASASSSRGRAGESSSNNSQSKVRRSDVDLSQGTSSFDPSERRSPIEIERQMPADDPYSFHQSDDSEDFDVSDVQIQKRTRTQGSLASTSNKRLLRSTRTGQADLPHEPQRREGLMETNQRMVEHIKMKTKFEEEKRIAEVKELDRILKDMGIPENELAGMLIQEKRNITMVLENGDSENKIANTTDSLSSTDGRDSNFTQTSQSNANLNGGAAIPPMISCPDPRQIADGRTTRSRGKVAEKFDAFSHGTSVDEKNHDILVATSSYLPRVDTPGGILSRASGMTNRSSGSYHPIGVNQHMSFTANSNNALKNYHIPKIVNVCSMSADGSNNERNSTAFGFYRNDGGAIKSSELRSHEVSSLDEMEENIVISSQQGQSNDSTYTTGISNNTASMLVDRGKLSRTLQPNADRVANTLRNVTVNNNNISMKIEVKNECLVVSDTSCRSFRLQNTACKPLVSIRRLSSDHQSSGAGCSLPNESQIEACEDFDSTKPLRATNTLPLIVNPADNRRLGVNEKKCDTKSGEQVPSNASPASRLMFHLTKDAQAHDSETDMFGTTPNGSQICDLTMDDDDEATQDIGLAQMEEKSPIHNMKTPLKHVPEVTNQKRSPGAASCSSTPSKPTINRKRFFVLIFANLESVKRPIEDDFYYEARPLIRKYLVKRVDTRPEYQTDGLSLAEGAEVIKKWWDDYAQRLGRRQWRSLNFVPWGPGYGVSGRERTRPTEMMPDGLDEFTKTILKVPPRPFDPYGWFVQDPYPLVVHKDTRALDLAHKAFIAKCIQSDKEIHDTQDVWRRNPDRIPADIRPWIHPVDSGLSSEKPTVGEIEAHSPNNDNDMERMDVEESNPDRGLRLRTLQTRSQNAARESNNLEEFAKSEHSKHDEVRGWLSKRDPPQPMKDQGRQQTSKKQNLDGGNQTRGCLVDKLDEPLDMFSSALLSADSAKPPPKKMLRKNYRILSSSDEDDDDSAITTDAEKDDPDFVAKKPLTTRQKEITRGTQKSSNGAGGGGAKGKIKGKRDSAAQKSVPENQNLFQRIGKKVGGLIGLDSIGFGTAKVHQSGELKDPGVSEERYDIIEEMEEPKNASHRTLHRDNSKSIGQSVVRIDRRGGIRGGRGGVRGKSNSSISLFDDENYENGQPIRFANNKNNSNNAENDCETSYLEQQRATFDKFTSVSQFGTPSSGAAQEEVAACDLLPVGLSSSTIELDGTMFVAIDKQKAGYQHIPPHQKIAIEGKDFITGFMEDSETGFALLKLIPFNSSDLSALGRPPLHRNLNDASCAERKTGEPRLVLQDCTKTSDVLSAQRVGAEDSDGGAESPKFLAKRNWNMRKSSEYNYSHKENSVKKRKLETPLNSVTEYFCPVSFPASQSATPVMLFHNSGSSFSPDPIGSFRQRNNEACSSTETQFCGGNLENDEMEYSTQEMD